MTINAEVRGQVARLLGREPRGLEAIAVSAQDGSPMVIRVSSLVDDTPFPTLFWLVDPALNYRIDQVEAAGLIKQFQRRADEDPRLQQQMRQDHLAHIALRASFITPATGQRLSELGFSEVLSNKGIGGIADYQRIRCLHTWYAAHLVVPNTIGVLLDQWWQASEDLASSRAEPPS